MCSPRGDDALLPASSEHVHATRHSSWFEHHSQPPTPAQAVGLGCWGHLLKMVSAGQTVHSVGATVVGAAAVGAAVVGGETTVTAVTEITVTPSTTVAEVAEESDAASVLLIETACVLEIVAMVTVTSTEAGSTVTVTADSLTPASAAM